MVCSIGNIYSNFVDYAEDNSLASNQTVENSRWFGRGAELLGLSNQVNSFSYKNAYQGVDDHGVSLRRKLKSRNSVPGRDLTFSAPKSVTLLALVKEDKQIINAHNHAVNRALDYIEQNCIYTRTGKGGNSRQQTHNMVAAIFQHQESRNLDPNLHSHCVVFNQTQGEDGKWRAMDNRELYQQKMTIGMVYRHELGQRIIELGHSINWREDGTFDLASFKPEQLQQFSSRRTEIIDVAGANSSGKAKAYACVSTRNKKRYVKAEARKTVRASWVKKYNSLNLSAAQISNKSGAELGKTLDNPQQLTSRIELIDRTIKTLDSKDNKTRFSKHELLKEVLIQAKGQYKLDLIQKGLEQHPSLIEIEDGKLTTFKLYRKERAQNQKNERSNTQASEQKKESNILESATSLLDRELHGQHTDSFSPTEKFSLIEVIDKPNGMASLRDNNFYQAVENYLQRDERQQSRTIILTDTKANENEITSHLRKKLIQQKKLGNDPIRSICLQRKNIGKIDLTKAENYQVGDMIKFNRQSKRFSSQHLYKVLSIDENRKVLNLGDRFGSRVELPLNRYQNREVFKVKKRELRLNEKLRFTRPQYVKNQQVSKGQVFSIVNLKDKQRITIKINGKKTTVKSSQLLYAEYDYAATVKECQGRNIDSCIYCPSTAKSIQSFKQDIYEIASRIKVQLTVYTSDNFREKVQPLQPQMEQFKQQNTTPVNTLKSIDDTLFELASSAKYIVLNEGNQNFDNQIEYFDLHEARNGGLLDRIVFDSPDRVMIEKDAQNLSIYYDGRTIEFDHDFNVKKNELTEQQTRSLNQRTQSIKQKILERSRSQKIQQNIDLSR